MSEPVSEAHDRPLTGGEVLALESVRREIELGYLESRLNPVTDQLEFRLTKQGKAWVDRGMPTAQPGQEHPLRNFLVLYLSIQDRLAGRH